MVKHLPTMWENPVQSFGREDLLEKEIAIHSSILAWEIPWTEDPGRLQSMGSQRVRHYWATSLSLTKTFKRGWNLRLNFRQKKKKKLKQTQLYWEIRTEGKYTLLSEENTIIDQATRDENGASDFSYRHQPILDSVQWGTSQWISGKKKMFL